MELKILIIADNLLLRRDIERGLKGNNGICVVHVGGDVIQALHKCQVLKPDLVLADVEMPVLNGLDITRMIKNISPSIKTIYVGTFEKSVYKNLFNSPFCDGYLQNDNMKKDIRNIISSMESRNL